MSQIAHTAMQKNIWITITIALIACSPGLAGNLPTIHITTRDSSAITSREIWKENASLQIVMPDGSVSYQSDKVAIRARGHSTFSKPKKPFALKLENAAPLLGMEADKRWVLLANFMDHSLLRNSLALAIARQTSLEWTPDSRLVDVVVNGKLQGCYLLCESVRVSKHRVNLNKEDGFLIEMDSYPSDEYRFETIHRHLPVNVKHPKNPTKEQIQDVEACLK